MNLRTVHDSLLKAGRTPKWEGVHVSLNFMISALKALGGQIAPDVHGDINGLKINSRDATFLRLADECARLRG
ncbi:MAG: hypothetical protein LBS77_02980 [Desulfovibrio sp.]|jgi:hypothetical protein|nr:hypothetical protein [Desulfovibrio sp.]